MVIPAMALLQQHDARRDILIELAARRRTAIEARGHSELGAFRTGVQSGRKNQTACHCCLLPLHNRQVLEKYLENKEHRQN